MHKYPTNLTDKQQQVIKNIRCALFFDGILYIVKTNGQWRIPPSDFAPWQTEVTYMRLSRTWS